MVGACINPVLEFAGHSGRDPLVVAVNFIASLFGVSSPRSQRRGGQIMNATTAKRAPRKVTKKATIKAAVPEYSPWVKRLNKLAEPLTGKLGKVIAK